MRLLNRASLILLCFFLFASLRTIAQGGPGSSGTDYGALPVVLPPQPNAAELTKPARIDMGLYSGTARFHIPIYTVKYRDVEIPIGLNYNSNGVKVDEMPSRVGIDWSLHAGGVITRTIMHQDDELVTRQHSPSTPTNLDSMAKYVFDFLIGNPNTFDTQADEFSYDFNGHQGKFILDENLNVIQLTISNLKIVKAPYNVDNTWDFKITDGDGVVYYFGGTTAREKAKTDVCTENFFDQYSNNSWYLIKTVYPNNDEVDYSYDALSLYTYDTHVQESIVMAFPTQQLDLGTKQMNSMCQFDPNDPPPNNLFGSTCDCTPFGETIISTPGTACPVHVTSFGTILKQITTNNGYFVDLYYSSRQDLVGDMKYDSIHVVYKGNLLKNIAFNYVYANAGTYYTGNFYNNSIPYVYKRLFLNSIVDKPVNNAGNNLIHSFAYNDMNSLPPRLSSAQDHFGYFNGQKNDFYSPFLSDTLNQYSLDPQTVSYATLQLFAELGGNREPDSNYSSKGVLTKINYPTGGSTSIDWEPNTINKWITIYPSNSNFSLGGTGTGVSGAVTYTSSAMVISYDQKIYISVTALLSGSDTLHTSVTVELKTAGGTSVYLKTIKVGQDYTDKIDVSAGTTYYLYCTVNGSAMTGAVNGYYRPGNTSQQQMNIQMPGLRVKRITESDSVGNTTIKKYYYACIDSLNVSSGVATEVEYYNDMVIPKYYWDFCMGAVLIANISLGKLSSSSLYPNYLTGQNPVNYTYVVEGFGENFENGGIEHKFLVNLDANSEYIYGNLQHNVPYANNGFMTGTEQWSRYFKSVNNQVVLIKTTQPYYSFDSRNFSWNNSFVLFKHDVPDHSLIPNHPDLLDLNFFDIAAYPRYSYWIHLDSTNTTDYTYSTGGSNLGSVTSTTYNSYNNLQHLQLTETKFVNSVGDTIKKQFSFPVDFVTAGNVYDTMVHRNMITKTVQVTDLKNSNTLQTTKLNYSFDWFTDKHLIEIQNVEIQKAGNTSESRLRNFKFDNSGNILEVAKENDTRIAYLWDYSNTLPVAQVKNATSQNIAYTSFEADSSGNWTISGGVATTAIALTGRRSYALSTGNSISRSGLTSGNYIVSYWLHNGSVSVNSGSGTAGPTRNGWTYYEHLLTNVTSVTITGTSATIDELRLYPATAQMVTYTYMPMIGIKTMCDVNNRITYYEYDEFNRLIVVRDQDNNVLKKNCYNFAGQEDHCTIYYNVADTGTYTKSNCPSGYTGSSVKYIVPAGTFVSTLSQQDADSRAQHDVIINGQAFADMYGTCAVTCTITNCPGQDKKCINNNCETGFKVYTSSTLIHGNNYDCTYHYEFSDGSWSQDYTETHTGPCIIGE